MTLVKRPNATFYGGLKRPTTNFPFSVALKNSYEFNSVKFTHIWRIKQGWINGKRFETMGQFIFFFCDVSISVVFKNGNNRLRKGNRRCRFGCVSSPLSGHVPNNSDILKTVFFFLRESTFRLHETPGLVSLHFSFLCFSRGAIHSTKIPTGPSGKSGPPQKEDQFFRNFSDWTKPIHWVLDRNFRKFWSNGSRPQSHPKSLSVLWVKTGLGSLRPSLGTGHATRLTVTLFRSDTPKPRLFATALQSGLGPIQTNPNFAVSKLSGVNWA